MYLLLLLLLLAATAASGQQPCPAQLFVSGYYSTVHVYDACTGQHLRDLEPPGGRIAGAQAVKLGSDGFIYVVSEEKSQILRYRADTLAFDSVAVTVSGTQGPTGFVFGDGGELWVGMYTTSTVMRYSAEGQVLGTLVPARAAGVGGIDNGLSLGRDGKLYIPGYDTHNIIRFDPATGQAAAVVPARANGLRNARGIFPDPVNPYLWITAEGSGQLLRYHTETGELRVMTSGLTRPTGVDRLPDGMLAVASGQGVVRIDPADGQPRGTLVADYAGGLSGPTYVAVINTSANRAAAPDAAQIGTQYWVVGTGRVNGNVIDVANMISATGTGFGDAFDTREIKTKRWGSLRLEFTACDRANFSWNASGAASAEFGRGGYTVTRLLRSEATQRCTDLGTADKTWMNGLWYGAEARSGEGVAIDKAADGTVFVAWFTHRPK
jgi:hypothetical protein